MKQLLKLIILIAGISVIAYSCGGDEKSKSMSELQNANGIPVSVQEVKETSFIKELSFFSKMYGVKQTTLGAMVGGRIERINTSIGASVKKDQVLIEFPADAPALGFEQAKAAYENSKKTYERMKVLLESGETSQAAFDGAETKYFVDKRNYEQLKQMLYIQAPFDGIISDVQVKVGDNVKGETPLLTIAQTYKVRAKVWVTESEINQIRTGMKATATIEGREYNGRVVEISLGMDPAHQAFYAEVEFDNPGNQIKIGVTAGITIVTYENNKAITVPRHLLKSDDKGQFIFLLNGDKAKKRYVTVKNESGIEFEISSGLNSGDKLIVKGVSQLQNDIKVKVIQ